MSDAKSPMNDLGALAFRVEATGVSDGSDGVVKVSGLGLPTGLQVVSSELVRALRGLVIEVEGNIGSGKSTLTETLRRAINDSDTNEQKPCIVHGEKVNTKFLTAYYNASKRYAFAFQSYMLTTRVYQLEESARQASEGHIVFLDRGAVGDTLFAIQNFNLGNMDTLDLEVYRSICHERLPKTLSDKVNVLLHLDVDPSECYRRMNDLRKRTSEAEVPLSYIEGLDSGYFHLLVNWIGGRQDGLYDMNVGVAPALVIIPWIHYGDATYVLTLVRDVHTGKRKSPRVIFRDIETETTRFSDGSDTNQVARTSGDLSAIYVSANPDATSQLIVNWNLDHNNTFKRTVMRYLCAAATVVFYGASPTVRIAADISSSSTPSSAPN